ncbi:glycosyltransferase family 2 protein [Microcella humidisoli]|uniref:Glycosyltransferase n=1 Tax=Microcella humidisoli TaxID=2963406 RepID=A0ABY5FXJ1_9MICO|nr:glycosyltransferase [Microcella humidisoli]UTT62999.1 glycosyltransferase [Microcella humidisoli]
MLVTLDDHPDVVALIPTLGASPTRLARAVASLVDQQGDARLAVLVIVNAETSSPTTLDPRVAVVHAGLNLGWAGGLAFGRSLVRAEQLWLVQDDMVLDPGCLSALRAALADDPGLALVAPMVMRDGLVVARTVGADRDDAWEFSGWYPEVDTPLDDVDRLEGFAYVGSRGMLVRTAMWDAVGGMDPRFYPVMWVDVDLCSTLLARGLRFRSVRDAHCSHEQSASTTTQYSAVLWHRNLSLLRQKHANGPAGRVPSVEGAVDARIEPALVATIARAAASLVRELADRIELDHAELERTRERHADLSSQRDDSEARIAAAEHRARLAELELAAMRASRSWRLTAPLRRIGARRSGATASPRARDDA